MNVHMERLVDGEMLPDEYREFVASLEDEPDGWRRCALSFLESQAFSQDLKDWVRDPAGDETTASALVAWRLLPRRWLELALVATVSFALAWGSSVAMRSWWPASDRVVPLDRQLSDRLQEPFRDGSSQYAVSSEKPLVKESGTCKYGGPTIGAAGRQWSGDEVARCQCPIECFQYV